MLKEVARLAKVHFGPKLCTYNLHMLICGLEDQEIARGKAAFGHEYWFEFCAQKCNSILDAGGIFPEITLAHHLLLEEALTNLKTSRGVSSFDESMKLPPKRWWLRMWMRGIAWGVNCWVLDGR
eukprot:jgi/Botrbrau1/20537/Bobra.145_2s0086.1